MFLCSKPWVSFLHLAHTAQRRGYLCEVRWLLLSLSPLGMEGIPLAWSHLLCKSCFLAAAGNRAPRCFHQTRSVASHVLSSSLPRLVREFVAQNNTSQIKHVILILSQEFALSQHPHSRKGGLIGLAACSIALGKVNVGVFWLPVVGEELCSTWGHCARERLGLAAPQLRGIPCCSVTPGCE